MAIQAVADHGIAIKRACGLFSVSPATGAMALAAGAEAIFAAVFDAILAAFAVAADGSEAYGPRWTSLSVEGAMATFVS